MLINNIINIRPYISFPSVKLSFFCHFFPFFFQIFFYYVHILYSQQFSRLLRLLFCFAFSLQICNNMWECHCVITSSYTSRLAYIKSIPRYILNSFLLKSIKKSNHFLGLDTTHTTHKIFTLRIIAVFFYFFNLFSWTRKTTKIRVLFFKKCCFIYHIVPTSTIKI